MGKSLLFDHDGIGRKPGNEIKAMNLAISSARSVSENFTSGSKPQDTFQVLCTRASHLLFLSKTYALTCYWLLCVKFIQLSTLTFMTLSTYETWLEFSPVGSNCQFDLVPMIVTTDAGTRGYSCCVKLHWHLTSCLSLHKFDIKNFKKLKEQIK